MPRRPTLFVVSALALTLLCGGPAAAQSPPPDAMAAARELVATMRAADQVKTLMPAIMQQLKPAIVQGRSQVEKDFDAVLPTVLEIVNARAGEMVDSIALVYARTFTADEMRQVTAFYRTPIGQKFLDKLPTLMQESMAVGAKFGQAMAGELRERMIQELRKRGHNI